MNLKISFKIMLLLLLMVVVGCKLDSGPNANPNIIKPGDRKIVKAGYTVYVHYVLKLDDGKVFDEASLNYTAGAKKVIPGFDKAVLGMKLGEEKEFSIKPEEGYGLRKESLIETIPISDLPENPTLGQVIVINRQHDCLTAFGSNDVSDPSRSLLLNRNTLVSRGILLELGNDFAKVDFNFSLAGKTLYFKVKVIDIQ